MATKTKYTVSVYMLDKSYGGPEEGGWWYTTGEPVHDPEHTRTFYNEEKARAYRRRLQLICDRWNRAEDRRSINSVLCDGEYGAVMDEGHPPRSFPQSRPYYE